MNYEIVKVVNKTKSGFPSPIKFSFDLKFGDVIIGTCQMLIENILLQFELIDGQGNRFTFNPNNKQSHDVESLNSENGNCFGVGEERNVKINEGI